MSHSEFYRRPFISYDWYGPERRQQDPLSQLRRSLYDFNRNATDPLELAAQLEAMGYNNYRVQQELGLNSTFELAQTLFDQVARKPKLKIQSQLGPGLSLWRQLSILLAVILSLGLQTEISGIDWGAILWLIAWSVAGTYMLQKARADQNPEEVTRIFNVLLLLGILGLSIHWLFQAPGLNNMLVGLLWLILTGSSWLESAEAHHGAWTLLPIAGAALPLLGFPTDISIFLLICLGFYLFLPFLDVPGLKNWAWFLRKAPMFITLLAYGFSLGWLIVRVFQLHHDRLFLGGALLMALFLVAEWSLLWLRRILAFSLWNANSPEDYRHKTWQSINLLPRLSIMALFIVVSTFLWWGGPSYSPLIGHFGLLGLSAALTLVLMTLDNYIMPSALFALAAVLVLLKFSLSWILLGLALILMIAVLLHLRNVEHYGLHVL